MARKTIRVTEETYHRLKQEQGPNECLSAVIDRLLNTEQHPLYSLVGLLSEDEDRTTQDRANEFRSHVNDRFDGFD